MTISVCVAGLIAEGKIKKGQGEEVERYYEAHYQALKGQMNEIAAAELASQRAIEQMQAQVTRRKMLAGLTILKQAQIDEQLRAFAGGSGDGPIHPDALPALIGGNDPRHLGGTLEGKHIAVQANIDNLMRGILLKHGADVIGRLRDKAGLDDLGREAFGQDSGNANAKALAQAWEGAREWSRARANAAGADIGKLADYGLRMHWDSAQVRALGSADAFKAIVLPELDRARMIDRETGAPFEDAKLRDTMDKVWQGIRSNGWDDREPGGFGNGGFANDGADPRFFVFKDYDAWNRVNDQLGNGNAFTSMNGMLESRARQIAAMETLGPNPDHTMKWATDLVDKSAATDMAPDGKGIERASQTNKQAMRMWQEFKGTLNLPESKAIASAFGTVRNVMTAAKLGTALISQQTDLVLQHMARDYNGLPAYRMMQMWVEMLTHSDADREFAARQLLGLQEQRHYTSVTNRLFGREFARPWSQRMVSTVMNLEGSARWAQIGRQGFGRDWWGAITGHRDVAWNDLDPTFRAGMTRGGFSEGDWDQLRATPLEEVRGSKWIMADNIADENLRLKTAEMILRQANTVLPIPDLRTRAALNSLVNRGSGPMGVLAEMERSAMMFKTFGVSILNTHLTRMMNMPLGSAVRYGVRLAIAGTICGALEMQLRHIIKGEDPEDMTHPGFIGRAILTGGSGGLFSDYINDAIRDPAHGLSKAFVGPLGEDLQNVTSVPLALDRNDHLILNKNWRGAAYKAARADLPGGTLWYGRLAFDRMIGDELQSQIDPNYRHSWETVASHARSAGSPMFAPPGGGLTGARAPDWGRAIGQPQGQPPQQ